MSDLQNKLEKAVEALEEAREWMVGSDLNTKRIDIVIGELKGEIDG